MIYQLVIQFHESAFSDFDELIDLEDKFEILLNGFAEFDGHDIGAGEVNFFILTNEPHESYKCLIHEIEDINHKAAFRKLDSEIYKLIWPTEGNFSIN